VDARKESKGEKMNFLLTLDTAEEFWGRCLKRNACTYEERIVIMEEMMAERKAFKQTDEQIRKRLTGKKVLRIKCKPSKHA
jgi:hypothetical protein